MSIRRSIKEYVYNLDGRKVPEEHTYTNKIREKKSDNFIHLKLKDDKKIY